MSQGVAFQDLLQPLLLWKVFEKTVGLNGEKHQVNWTIPVKYPLGRHQAVTLLQAGRGRARLDYKNTVFNCIYDIHSGQTNRPTAQLIYLALLVQYIAYRLLIYLFSALFDCLPLPPPIGCAEHQQSREVLDDEETDFAWLSLFSVFPAFIYLISCLVVYTDTSRKSIGIEELSAKRTQIVLIITTGLENRCCPNIYLFCD